MGNFIYLLFAVIGFLVGCSWPSDNGLILVTGEDYPVYGGNKAGNRYSPLDQINLDNVSSLQVVWTYDAARALDPKKEPGQQQIQCQPIVVRGILYGTTPDVNLFALDARTGKQLWIFEREVDNKKYGIINVNRGVAYWEDGKDKRILFTSGSTLYCVNADKGTLIKSFGENGKVDLHTGLSDGLNKDVQPLSVVATSPGVIYKDNFIIGSGLAENGKSAPGYIRSFNVRSGKLSWVFHTIPHPGEPGYETWPENAYTKIGGANSWAGLTVDEKRGWVFIGTGSPAPDFYGGDREGMNLFANCVLALDARTGELKWYYQIIHHDLWDRDLPLPPNLGTITKDGEQIDVAVQATKDGLIYVLNRETGESLFQVEDRPVPTDGLPGEHPWPTQKFPVKPAPLSRQVYTESDISDISPESYEYTKEQFLKYRTDNKFQPPSKKGTLLFGYSGGVEWGGNAIDPDGIFYQNSNDDPWILEMADTATINKEIASVSKGNALYIVHCAACHGQDRRGNGTQFPNLINIEKRLNVNQIQDIVRMGRGRMPSFQQIGQGDRDAIINYLLNKTARVKRPASDKDKKANSELDKKKSVGENGLEIFGSKPRYVIRAWKKLNDQNGYPGIKPPWGTMNAIDLKTGEYLWRVPLGEYPELAKKGIPQTGTDSYGGPLVTGGNLVFIAGTRDEKIRAFDKSNGKIVWEYQLPAGGFATPITYEVEGKQYLVIAAGGARGQKPGGTYIAFALEN